MGGGRQAGHDSSLRCVGVGRGRLLFIGGFDITLAHQLPRETSSGGTFLTAPQVNSHHEGRCFPLIN